MKQFRILLLMFALSLAFVKSNAEVVIIDGVKYAYGDIGDASVRGYDGDVTDVVIKDSINGRKVSIIDYSAFSYCTSLKSVVLPKGIVSIERFAFNECRNLVSIVIKEGLKTISGDAFHLCNNLSYISLPEGLLSIGDDSFVGCHKLTSLRLPESVTRIGNRSFYNCDGLKSVSLSTNLKEIGDNAFSSCDNLDTVFINYNIEYINNYAFSGTDIMYMYIKGDGVADYNIVKTVVSNNDALIILDSGMFDRYVEVPEWDRCPYRLISAEMFEQKTVELTADENTSTLYEVLGDSSSLVTNLKIKGSINGYDIMTLRNKMSRLLYLDLSDAIIVANDGGYEYYTGSCLMENDVLGESAFNGTKLFEVKLPQTLRKIERYAFMNCYCLKKVSIPNTVVKIGDRAFYECKSLTSTIVIPDGVETIQSEVFTGCRSLDSVYIGKNVKTIVDNAFRHCLNLKFVSFNQSLRTIMPYAFYYCTQLRSVSLPYTVETIGARAFEDCDSLKFIKIPSMTSFIGEYAFYGCDDIENVYTYTVEPTLINQNTFSCYASAILNVPKASMSLYEYDTKWSQFQNYREFDEPYDAFYLNGDLCLDDNTGRLGGEPDAQMYATSGIVVEGEQVQELKDVELTHDGKDGGTIIGAANDVTGSQVNLTAQSLKVNISVDGGRWYFFCFPFDVVHDSIECTAGYVFYNYDGSKRANDDSGWTKLASDFELLQKGVGYIFRIERTGILTIHVGSEYLTFTAGREREALNEYASADATNAGWNMIGNPFISYYDVQDLAQEYDAPIVIWNGYGYDAYKPGDDDYQLKPFEAFFVQKESGSSYVEFLPENRMTYNQAATRSSLRAARRAQMGTTMDLDRQLVNIVLMGQDSVTDRTRIVYSVNASMDYEIGVDAVKFQADGVPQLYTLNGKTKYAINERPMGTDEIKLGYTAPKAGTYTLSVTRHDAEIEIYDNVAKSKVDFTFGDYSFQSQAGTFNDRFVVYKTSGGVTKVDNGFRLDGMTVKTIDGGIVIEGNLTGKVQVYSDSGMLLAEPNQPGFVELADGVYIVRVVDKNVKLFVK